MGLGVRLKKLLKIVMMSLGASSPAKKTQVKPRSDRVR